MPAREEKPCDKTTNFPTGMRCENPEGDWQAYVSACSTIDAAVTAMTPMRVVLSSKRACALAYLGRRAQNQGAVYSKRGSRIFTPSFISTMEAVNRTQRFKRYPWLERLLALVAEIEEVQNEISLQGNILPFSRPTK
jgi:hypothetical protein